MAGDTTITLRMNNSELEKSNQLLDKYQQKVTVASRKSEEFNKTFRAATDTQKRYPSLQPEWGPYFRIW